MKLWFWLICSVGLVGCQMVSRPADNVGACTMEAKICPDGTSVGRVGPECEFAPCPVSVGFEPYTARFSVTTSGLLRDFSGAMYLNQDTDVFIGAADPGLVYVNAAEITWADFFETLPFSVSQECLITGLGERLCNAGGRTLVFKLNGLETEGVLEQVIGEGDVLEIIYQ